jgi:hypothetical protein
MSGYATAIAVWLVTLPVVWFCGWLSYELVAVSIWGRGGIPVDRPASYLLAYFALTIGLFSAQYGVALWLLMKGGLVHPETAWKAPTLLGLLASTLLVGLQNLHLLKGNASVTAKSSGGAAVSILSFSLDGDTTLQLLRLPSGKRFYVFFPTEGVHSIKVLDVQSSSVLVAACTSPRLKERLGETSHVAVCYESVIRIAWREEGSIKWDIQEEVPSLTALDSSLLDRFHPAEGVFVQGDGSRLSK